MKPPVAGPLQLRLGIDLARALTKLRDRARWRLARLPHERRRHSGPKYRPLAARRRFSPAAGHHPHRVPAKSDLYTYIESLELVRCQRAAFLRAVFARRAAREPFLGNNCVRDWREIVRLARVDRTPAVRGETSRARDGRAELGGAGEVSWAARAS